MNDVMKKLIALSVEGAKIIDLCVQGDKLLEEATGAVYNKSVKGVKASKGMPNTFVSHLTCSQRTDGLGIAFPTCFSVNNAVSHFSPLAYVFRAEVASNASIESMMP